MNKKYLFYLLPLLIIACTTSSNKNWETVKKLTGHWATDKLDDEATIEYWEQKNDSTLLGLGYTIRNMDTTLIEFLSIEKRNETIQYNVRMQLQNDEKPIAFKLSTYSTSELLFENPTHDFPQYIHYKNIGNNSMQAIVGNKNGKSFTLSFEKIQ